MSTALITLSPQGLNLAVKIAAELPGCEIFVHSSAGILPAGAKGVSPSNSPTANDVRHSPAAAGGLPFGAVEAAGNQPPSNSDERQNRPPTHAPTQGCGSCKSQTTAGETPAILEGKMPSLRIFDSVCGLTAEIFARFTGLVYILPTGVAVRAIAPHAKHKTTDPAVVAMDVGGRWAVSLLSGHEGGANDLAVAVANAVGAEPIISTTTEAVKDIIVGVGCRRGIEADAIVAAVQAALKLANVDVRRLRLIASADIKKDEAGLIEAARLLGAPIRFIESGEIRLCPRPFEESALAHERVSLPAVAEPCALLAGRRTELILPRQKMNGVTVAVAREHCWSLE